MAAQFPCLCISLHSNSNVAAFKPNKPPKALCIAPRMHNERFPAMVKFQDPSQNSGFPDRTVRIEQLWREFFSDPSKWWDNRLFKKSIKYPDFEHKITRECLWIGGRMNPPWVKAKMAMLELDQVQCKDELKLWLWEHFDKGDYVRKLSQEGQLEDAMHKVELLIQRNIKAPINVYVGLVKACARVKNLENGRRMHALIFQSGLDSDIFVGSSLVDMYSKGGSVMDAWKVFSKMPAHNVFSWTAIISAYADHGQGQVAIDLFQQMRQTGILPDKVAFVIVLRACARIKALQQGMDFHSEIIKCGFGSDLVVGNTLIEMYAKCGQISVAREVFDAMPEHNVFSWTAIISAYMENGEGQEAIDLFGNMEETGLVPDKVIIILVLKACASIATIEHGKQLHARIKKAGFELDMVVSSALVDMYAKCGCIEEAREVFDKMNEQDVVSWNAMIAGYAQQGLVKEAFALYEVMKQKNLQPSSVTYVVLLNACASMASLVQGKQLHAEIVKCGDDMDVVLASALVDMYAKCGSIDHACQVFNNMQEPNVVTWTGMIAGYAQQGLGKEALTLLEQMQREGIKPNEVTYITVLSACSHSGLVDEGQHIFDCMLKDRNVTPTMDHYTCMVDLLSRAGSLADAEDFIKKMPIQPNAVVWMTLLGAARNHGHVEIGRRAFDCVVALEPENPTAYVLLSNLYAEASVWKETIK